ncbi:hypothetical protein M1N13_00290 [Dehalococcoidia bacterium]|nr:hypothetical protein [Dehalococcoidia bacterium]
MAKEVAAMKLTNQQKGKSVEFLVFAELIRRGADLYLPVIDSGIDAIIRRKDGTYLQIQVKSTEEDDQAGYFNVSDINERPEDKFFIICVDINEKNFKVEGRPNIWILSAKDFKEYMTSGCRLPIYDRSQKHGNKRRCELLQDNFEAWEPLTG